MPTLAPSKSRESRVRKRVRGRLGASTALNMSYGVRHVELDLFEFILLLLE